MTGAALAFSEGALGVEEGALGEELKSRVPAVLQLFEQMFKVGESAAFVGSVFTIFAVMVSNYQTVQGVKSDFIDG